MEVEAARELSLHVETCTECTSVLEQLRRAREVLSSQSTEPAPFAEARMWRQITAPRRPARSPWSLAASGAVVVVLVLLLARSWPMSSSARPKADAAPTKLADVPREVALIAKRSTELDLHGARVEVAQGTRFSVRDLDGSRIQIQVDTGAVRSRGSSPGIELEILTRDARITGTHLFVRAAEATDIEVEDGASSVWMRGETAPIALHGGERIRLLAKRAIVRPQAGTEEGASELKARGPRIDRAHRPSVREEAMRTGEGKEPPVDAAEPARYVSTLETAKAELAHDAPRAAALAQQVLDQNPPQAQQAEALAVLADAERRRGNASLAASLYDRLARHPSGGPFAEEALLQRAILLADLGDDQGALGALRRADEKYPAGATTPERTALEAKLLLLGGDALRAAEVIESARNVGVSLELLRRRVEVARALLESSPQRSLSLVAPACEPSVPSSVRAAALAISRIAADRAGLKVEGRSGESSPESRAE
jgi:hypothetical protein